MLLSFERDPDGSWYIILKEWKGPRGMLQMVSGADDFLDMIAGDDNLVTLDVVLTPESGYDRVEMLGKGLYGADYYIESYAGTKIYHKFWLCPVTTFVFGGVYPEVMYIKKQIAENKGG